MFSLWTHFTLDSVQSAWQIKLKMHGVGLYSVWFHITWDILSESASIAYATHNQWYLVGLKNQKQNIQMVDPEVWRKITIWNDNHSPLDFNLNCFLCIGKARVNPNNYTVPWHFKLCLLLINIGKSDMCRIEEQMCHMTFVWMQYNVWHQVYIIKREKKTKQ